MDGLMVSHCVKHGKGLDYFQTKSSIYLNKILRFSHG